MFVETTSVTGEVSETVPPAHAKTLFHWSDVVHHHAPLRRDAPENTFCFAVLRDPEPRLVSQVLDWRRLNDSDTVGSPPGLRACIADSGGCHWATSWKSTRTAAAGRYLTTT